MVASNPIPPFSVLCNMSTAASIELGILTPDLREALRTLLSRRSKTYLELPSTADAPGVCISTSYADLRRVIEADYQAKLDSDPKVPANYSISGRRRLPDAAPVAATRQYLDAGTQTEAGLRSIANQVESASESGSRRSRKSQRAAVSRIIYSSSTETDAEIRPARPVESQGLWSPCMNKFHANSH